VRCKRQGCLRPPSAVLAVVLTLAACSSGIPPLQPSTIARIRLPVAPFAIAAGYGSIWALTRQPSPAVWRIDPRSNRVSGRPTRLPIDPWSVAVGVGSVWVTPNGADGRLTRINPRTGRITGRIAARPVYFGSAIAIGAGDVWTGNDDERYQAGATVTKLDPRTDRLVGAPLVLGSPQSIAFGAGAVWVADHTGWLVKIDPRTMKILARRRLGFGPHGVVVTAGAVYIADAHGGRLLRSDATTGTTNRVRHLPIGPIYPVAGARSIWSGSAAAWADPTADDDRLVRIDPRSLKVQATFHLGSNVTALAYGFGSVWAAVANRQVVRLRP
jgi:hypothetical protein